MGDTRGFEAPIPSGDLWPVGFDVDLTLDHPNNRKYNVGFVNGGSSSSNHNGAGSEAGGLGLPYGEMQQMLLQRFDFNEGDISQITELTNSLPKGDNDSAQGCYELTSHLNNTSSSASKRFETSLFSNVIPAGLSKLSLHPVDVYGRVTLYEGKLVIQLRHFNISTNYPVNVGECWLCREKLACGSQIHSHKHVLQGLFQVNDEFVQMDIDHYIIPEQALEPVHCDIRINQTNSLSAIEKVGVNKEMIVNEEVCHNVANSQQHSISLNGSESLHIVNQIGLPVTVNQNDKNYHPIEYSGTNFINLASSVQPMSKSAGDGHISFPCDKTVSSSELPNHDSNCSVTSNIPPLQINSLGISSLNKHTSAGESTSETDSMQSHLVNIDNINTLNTCAVPTLANRRNIEFPQNSIYESGIDPRETLENCHSFFDNHNNYYSYEGHNNSENETKFTNTALVPSTCFTYQALNTVQEKKLTETFKKAEIGAKKRKGRSQRKPINIKVTLDEKPLETNVSNSLETTENVLGNSNDESLEDWFQNTLSGNSGNSKKPEHLAVPDLSSTDISSTMKRKSIGNSKQSLNKNSSKNETVINVLPVSCQICSQKFNNLPKFKSHLEEHDLPSSIKLVCCKCSKTISNIDEYINHLSLHSRNRLTCKLCSNTFSKIDKLQRHIETIHNSAANRQYKCHICTKAFHRSDYLKTHINNIHVGRKFLCNICKKYYSSQYNLDVHIKSHSNTRPFACELCDKSYPRKSSLVMHVSIVHGNQKFECDVCLKSFSRPDVLMRHKIIHNDFKVTHDCEICGKKFQRKDRLTAHVLEHQFPPKNKCTQCPVILSRKTTLHKHLITHKNNEQCNICFNFFPTVAKLQKHLHWHEKNIKNKLQQQHVESQKCEFCSKSFKSKERLRRHVSRNHCKKDLGKPTVKPVKREKFFFCKFCSKSFARSCNLRGHLKIHSESKVSEDEEVLADLPTVLNATKASSLKTKITSNCDRGTNSCKDDASSSNSPQLTNLSAGTSSTSHLLFNHEFVPISASSHLSSYNSNYQANLSSEIPVSTSSFSDSSPNSPINLSTEAITAAAYLLAHPFYEGPYQ